MPKNWVGSGVNGWTLLLLLLAGLALGLLVLAPHFRTDENQRALQKLNEVLTTWATAVQDLRAEVRVTRPDEPTLHATVLYLAGLAVRVELKEPKELAGEVYALRAVPEGWLLVHFRPGLLLGLEARFSPETLGKLLGAWGETPKRMKVTWPAVDTVRLSGLSGPFPTVEIQLGEPFSLPKRIFLWDERGHRTEMVMDNLIVNGGLELRELLLLDPFPTRWIRIPIPEGGA
jgi:hypothetical protein